jgi:hypothetical protein
VISKPAEDQAILGGLFSLIERGDVYPVVVPDVHNHAELASVVIGLLHSTEFLGVYTATELCGG